MTALDHSRLRAEVVRIARANVGYGEHNRNFLAAIGSPANAEWCAVFAGYCYRKAHANLKLPPPIWVFANYPASRGRLQLGAKGLTKALGRAGSIWKPYQCDSNRPKPGDLVCWSRGVLGWTGHVGIVSEVMSGDWFRSVEGNVGRKVVERIHHLDETKLWRFASVEL